MEVHLIVGFGCFRCRNYFRVNYWFELAIMSFITYSPTFEVQPAWLLRLVMFSILWSLYHWLVGAVLLFHRCYNLVVYFLHLRRYLLIDAASGRRLCHSNQRLVSTNVSVEYFLNCSIFSGVRRPHSLFLGLQLSASPRAFCLWRLILSQNSFFCPGCQPSLVWQLGL